MGDKTNRMSVFLVSKDVKDIAEITDGAGAGIEIDGVGRFYSVDSTVFQPSWVKDFFGNKVDGKFKIHSASARGLLIVSTGEGEEIRHFAITFGNGRHFLKEGVIDDRFGLKVVLNTVERRSLRSIDKTALGSVPKQSREQMSGESEFANFGVDVEQDLVNSVTGRSKETRLGKTITGRDALTFSAKVDVDTVKDLLPVLLERFESKDYQKEFDWIDQIKDVRNAKLRQKLDGLLVAQLNAPDHGKVWLAPPAVLDWVDVQGFAFTPAKKAQVHEDLLLADLILRFNGEAVTLEGVKSRRIYAKSAKSDDVLAHWNAYKCLYAEVELDNSTFVLNNGLWYEIAKGFADAVVAEFNAFPAATILLPEYDHENEGAYNEALPAKLDGSVCLDQKLISHGGGRSRIEFCDLKAPGGKLVHVKHYSGSAQLSHLFNQGVVSAELFLQDPDFREKLNEILPDGHKIADPSARPNAAEHEVVFAIISQSKNPLELPFFSKVSLRNARRRLRGFGYGVSIAKISHAAPAAPA